MKFRNTNKNTSYRAEQKWGIFITLLIWLSLIALFFNVFVIANVIAGLIIASVAYLSFWLIVISMSWGLIKFPLVANWLNTNARGISQAAITLGIGLILVTLFLPSFSLFNHSEWQFPLLLTFFISGLAVSIYLAFQSIIEKPTSSTAKVEPADPTPAKTKTGKKVISPEIQKETIARYIREHQPKESRYAIDSYLLRAKYPAQMIEEVWHSLEPVPPSDNPAPPKTLPLVGQMSWQTRYKQSEWYSLWLAAVVLILFVISNTIVIAPVAVIGFLLVRPFWLTKRWWAFGWLVAGFIFLLLDCML